MKRTNATCENHGGFILSNMRCQTESVLKEVSLERMVQFGKYGTNEKLEDGTGPELRWLMPINLMSAESIERVFRQDYEDYEEETGAPTWVHLIREEVAEAFKESDPDKLRAELIQVAALCVSWVEKLDARKMV